MPCVLCNLTQNYLGKQALNSLILMTSKEHPLNDKKSWHYLNIEKDIFTCKHVVQDISAIKEYILKLQKDLESKK